MKELKIDLSQPPDKRWTTLKNYQAGFYALLNFFSGEILELVPAAYINVLNMYAQNYLTADHYRELEAISKNMDMPIDRLLAGNLYYDALKIALGCSAFCITNSTGPVHGRNLDWFCKDDDLKTHSTVTRFVNGKNEYLTIGWPGFTGCLSGMAIGKFSISLNSVWSNEKPTMAEPVTYLIRKVLETAVDFNAAIEQLKNTPIASDCLLLVCGTRENEMAVVERTPTKGLVRIAKNGKVLVTNDYKLIKPTEKEGLNEIFDTSCGRYDRMEELLEKDPIFNPNHIHRVLSDAKVRMGITMQQMYFHPKTGNYRLF